MSFTQNSFNNVSSGGGSSVRIWSYINQNDTVSTIKAAGYFNGMRFSLNQNDIIFIIGSDASEIVLVTSLVNTSSVTVVNYDVVALDSITNSDISDAAAIAFSKLEPLTDGKILLGNATDVATPTTIWGDVTIDNTGLATIGSEAVGVPEVTAAIPKVLSVSVSASEMRDLYSSPKQILPTPGASEYYLVQGAHYEFIYGGAQYLLGGVFGLQYDSTAMGLGILAHTGISAATILGIMTDWILGAAGFNVAGLVGGATASMQGKGLYLSNKTANFITGTSEVVVHVSYTNVTVAP